MSQFQIILAPLFALLVMAFMFNAVLRRFHTTAFEQPIIGALFGVSLVVGMSHPIVLGEGIIFDARTLLVAAATAFGGALAGAVTLGFGLAGRAYMGGVGLWAGMAGMVLTYAIALGWLRWGSGRIKNSFLADTALGFVSTGAMATIFLLPLPLAMMLLPQILPTVLLTNMLGMMAIGYTYRREVQYFEDTKRLAAYAKTDPLTGTLNRRGLDRAYHEACKLRAGGHAMLYFDIDDFKVINDTYGHEAGDRALEAIADRVTQCVRGEAIFARHGGDEFSIYLPGTSADELQIIADRLCRIIATTPITHKDRMISISISIGGVWTMQEMTLQELITAADAQLMQAKRQGKNRALIQTEQGPQDQGQSPLTAVA